MTPYLMLVLVGFAVFIGVLGVYSVRAQIDGGRSQATVNRPEKTESSS